MGVQVDPPRRARRRTRAEQTAATKLAILDALIECLIEEGYAGLSTRAVAERAGVAQSTLMHHLPTRDAFLVEGVTHLAMRLADEALDALEIARLRVPDQREAILDQAWKEFTSPPAVAAAQMWAAAWVEPELAATLRDIEQRLSAIIVGSIGAVLPDVAEDPEFPALLEMALTLIRGLVMAIPVAGPEEVDARWEAMKPRLIQAAGLLLDEPR